MWSTSNEKMSEETGKQCPYHHEVYPETKMLAKEFMRLCTTSCLLGPDKSKNKQIKMGPEKENVSLELNLGVSVQLATLLDRWQVQYQALGRVIPANYKICQLDMEKEEKKTKSQIYHVHLLGRQTAREGVLIVPCMYGPGLDLSDNSSEYRLYQTDI